MKGVEVRASRFLREDQAVQMFEGRRPVILMHPATISVTWGRERNFRPDPDFPLDSAPEGFR